MTADKRLVRAIERLEAEIGIFVAARDPVVAGLATPPGQRDVESLRAAIAALHETRPGLRIALRAVWNRLGGKGADARPGERIRGRLPRTAAERLEARARAAMAPAERLEKRWRGVAGRLARAVSGKRVALEPVFPADDPRVSQRSIINGAFAKLDDMRRTGGQSDEALAHGCFSDIPLPPSMFLELIHAAWRLLAAEGRAEGARFLDVGCGAGSKPLLASLVFDRADGLEYDPVYFRDADALLGSFRAPNGKAIHGDALAFEGYRDYDVIYFYRPMVAYENITALERQVVAHVRPGTILIAPYEDFFLRNERLGAPRAAELIAVAGRTPAEVRAMVAAAERTGVTIPPPGTAGPRSDEGLWGPVMHALRVNGFAE